MIKSQPYRKGIFISTSLNIVAKLFVFLNTLVITYYFGTHVETDIFFYIISITTLLCNSISGIDLLVLIPEIIKLREQENEVVARRFTNFFIYLYITIGIVFALFIFQDPINFYSKFSKFDIEKLQQYRSMLYFGIGIILFQLVNNLLTAVLTSYKFFTSPIIANIINSLFTIAFTFFCHSHLGIKATLLGVLLGYIINFFLLIITMRFQLQWDFFDVKWMGNILVWKNIGLMQLNILPVWLRNYVSVLLLSGMATGTITALNIAQNVALVPEVFIASQVLAIASIKFSELNALNDFTFLKDLLNTVLIGLLLVIVPVAIIFAVCSKDIISILYLRGNFNVDALSMTSFCLFYLAILMPFKIPDVLFTRLFTSLQLYGTSVFFGMSAHIIITLLTYYLTTYFGIVGYFSSLLIGYGIIMPLVFFLILHIKASNLKSFTLFKNLIYMLGITIVIIPIAHYSYLYFFSSALINVLFTTLFVLILFWVLSYWLLDIKSIKLTLRQIFFRLKSIIY